MCEMNGCLLKGAKDCTSEAHRGFSLCCLTHFAKHGSHTQTVLLCSLLILCRQHYSPHINKTKPLMQLPSSSSSKQGNKQHCHHSEQSGQNNRYVIKLHLTFRWETIKRKTARPKWSEKVVLNIKDSSTQTGWQSHWNWKCTETAITHRLQPLLRLNGWTEGKEM